MYSKLRGTAYFRDYSVNNNTIDVGIFTDNAINQGNALSALFKLASKNLGYVRIAALQNGAVNEHEMDFGYFYDNSQNQGIIYDRAAFFDYSINQGTVSGVAVFDDNSVSDGVLLSAIYKSENVVTSGEMSVFPPLEYVHPDGYFINGYYLSGVKTEKPADPDLFFKISDYWYDINFYISFSSSGIVPANTTYYSLSDSATYEYRFGKQKKRNLTPDERALALQYFDQGNNTVGYTSSYYWFGVPVASSLSAYLEYKENNQYSLIYSSSGESVIELSNTYHGLAEDGYYYLSGGFVAETFEGLCNAYAFITSLTGQLSLSAVNLTGGEDRYYYDGMYLGTSAVYYDFFAAGYRSTGNFLSSNRWYLTGAYVAGSAAAFNSVIDNIAENLVTTGEFLSTSRWYLQGDFAGVTLISYYDYAALYYTTEREYISSGRWYHNGLFVGDNFSTWYTHISSEAYLANASGLYQNTGYYFLTGTLVSESFESFIDELAKIANTDGEYVDSEYTDTERYYSYGDFIGGYNNYIDVLAGRVAHDGEYYDTGRFYHDGTHIGGYTDYIDFLAKINYHYGKWEDTDRWYVNGDFIGIVTDDISYYDAYADYQNTIGELIVDGIYTSRYYFNGVYCCDTFYGYKVEEANRQNYTGSLLIDGNTVYFSGGEIISTNDLLQSAINQVTATPFTGKIPISNVSTQYNTTYNFDVVVEFQNSSYANKYYIQGIEISASSEEEFNAYIDQKVLEYFQNNCEGEPVILNVWGIETPIQYFSCLRNSNSLITEYTNWWEYSQNYGKLLVPTKIYKLESDYNYNLQISPVTSSYTEYETYKYSSTDTVIYSLSNFANYVAGITNFTGVLTLDFPNIQNYTTYRYYSAGTYVSHITAYLQQINSYVKNGPLREGPDSDLFYYYMSDYQIFDQSIPSEYRSETEFALANNITGTIKYHWYDEVAVWGNPPKTLITPRYYYSNTFFFMGTAIGTNMIQLADYFAAREGVDGKLDSISLKGLLTDPDRDYLPFASRYYCKGTYTGDYASSIPYMCRLITPTVGQRVLSGSTQVFVYTTDAFLNAASRNQYLYSVAGYYRADENLVPNAKLYGQDANGVDNVYIETNSMGKIISTAFANVALYSTIITPLSNTNSFYEVYHYKYPLLGQKLYSYPSLLTSQLSTYARKVSGDYVALITERYPDPSVISQTPLILRINTYGAVVSTFSAITVSQYTDGVSSVYLNPNLDTFYAYNSASFSINYTNYISLSETNYVRNIELYTLDNTYIVTNSTGRVITFFTNSYLAKYPITLYREEEVFDVYSTSGYVNGSKLYPSRLGSLESCCTDLLATVQNGLYKVDTDDDGFEDSVATVTDLTIVDIQPIVNNSIQAFYRISTDNDTPIDNLPLSRFYFEEIDETTGLPVVDKPIYWSNNLTPQNIVDANIILYVSVDDNGKVNNSVLDSNNIVAYGIQAPQNIISIESVDLNSIVLDKSFTFTQYLINFDYSNNFSNVQWSPLEPGTRTIYFSSGVLFEEDNPFATQYVPSTGTFLYKSPFSSSNQLTTIPALPEDNAINLTYVDEYTDFSLIINVDESGFITKVSKHRASSHITVSKFQTFTTSYYFNDDVLLNNPQIAYLYLTADRWFFGYITEKNNPENLAVNIETLNASYVPAFNIFISSDVNGLITNYITDAYFAPQTISIITNYDTGEIINRVFPFIGPTLYPNRFGSNPLSAEFDIPLPYGRYICDENGDGAPDSIINVTNYTYSLERSYLAYSVETYVKTAALSSTVLSSLTTVTPLSTLYFTERDILPAEGENEPCGYLPQSGISVYTALTALDIFKLKDNSIWYYCGSAFGMYLDDSYNLLRKETVPDNALVMDKYFKFTKYEIDSDSQLTLLNTEAINPAPGTTETPEWKFYFTDHITNTDVGYLPATGAYMYSLSNGPFWWAEDQESFGTTFTAPQWVKSPVGECTVKFDCSSVTPNVTATILLNELGAVLSAYTY